MATPYVRDIYGNCFEPDITEWSFPTCVRYIKAWKGWYFKTSSRKAYISIRCSHADGDPRTWKYFIELWVNDRKGKSALMFQSRIRPEAYAELKGDREAENYTGIAIVTLYKHSPEAVARLKKAGDALRELDNC